MKNKISIILPVYNSDARIEKTIDSIIDQSYKNFELIIINDGSTDKSGKICSKFAAENSNIIYIETANGGVSSARNIGLKNISGEYVTFIDSDDTYRKDFLKEMINWIENKKCDLAICGYKVVNDNFAKDVKINYNIDNVSIECFFEKLSTKILSNQVWNKIYSSKIIKENNLKFDESLDLAEDMKFNIEYIRYVEKISYYDEVLYEYTTSNNGLGFKYREDAALIKIRIYYELERLYDEKGCNKEFIIKRYLKQILSHYENIEKSKNNIKDKIKNIKKFYESIEYKYIRDIAFHSSKMLIRILGRIILLRNTVCSIFIGKIVKIVDNIIKKSYKGV